MQIETIRLLGRRLPMTLVEIVADDGTVGIGGADAPVAALRPIIEQEPWNLARIVQGQDARDVRRLAGEMFVTCLGQSGLVTHAQAALDMALWDLHAKQSRVPLYRLLGGVIQDRIMPYASATAFDLTNGLAPPLRFKRTERLVSEARARVQEGFRAIKFGWGDHFAPPDLERLAAIRTAIGPDVRLMLDFGGPDYFAAGVTPTSAAQIAALLEAHDVFFFEEPLPPYDVAGYATLTRRSVTPIATGEMLCQAWEFERFIEARAVNVIQPDAYRIGITQTLQVAQRARDAGIHCVPHSPWSALAIAAHVHVLATVPNGIMVEYPSPSLYTDTVRHGEVVRLATGDLVEHPLRPVDGYLALPEGPGLGVGGFNPEAIARMEALTAEGLER